MQGKDGKGILSDDDRGDGVEDVGNVGRSCLRDADGRIGKRRVRRGGGGDITPEAVYGNVSGYVSGLSGRCAELTAIQRTDPVRVGKTGHQYGYPYLYYTILYYTYTYKVLGPDQPRPDRYYYLGLTTMTSLLVTRLLPLCSFFCAQTQRQKQKQDRIKN